MPHSPHPNIVVILSDQLRADCVGCYGNPIIRTPHIDALAAYGVRFAQTFAQHPQCAPSRAALMIRDLLDRPIHTEAPRHGASNREPAYWRYLYSRPFEDNNE